jgi:hypothetical protein
VPVTLREEPVEETEQSAGTNVVVHALRGPGADECVGYVGRLTATPRTVQHLDLLLSPSPDERGREAQF